MSACRDVCPVGVHAVTEPHESGGVSGRGRAHFSEREGREHYESPLGMYWPRRFRDSQCARDLDPVHSFLLEPPLASPSQSRCVVYVCTEVPGHGF